MVNLHWVNLHCLTSDESLGGSVWTFPGGKMLPKMIRIKGGLRKKQCSSKP